MRAVVALAESVPHVNTQEAAAAQTAQRVRARFRAVTSMAGLPVVFDSKGLVGPPAFRPSVTSLLLLSVRTSAVLGARTNVTCSHCTSFLHAYMKTSVLNLYMFCPHSPLACLLCARLRRKTFLSELKEGSASLPPSRARDGARVEKTFAAPLFPAFTFEHF